MQKPWTDEERKFLEVNHNALDNNLLSKALGRTEMATAMAISRLGLQRSSLVIARMKADKTWKGGVAASRTRFHKVHPEARALYSRYYREHNPERAYANNVIGHLVRDGVLPKLPTGMNQHHDNYSKPKEVRVLNTRDHWEADKKRRRRDARVPTACIKNSD